MENKNVIHVQIKETNEHKYFGSMKSIYKIYSPGQLGIAYNTLKCKHSVKEETPFENSKCIIRKGEIVRAPKNV